MENVSKVLLIAATVLIVILLITVGIRIVNTSGNSAGEAVSVVGKQIELKTSDASDVIAGYSVKRYPDTQVKFKNNKAGYYINYFTGIEIDENVTYTISFDYTIEQKEGPDINCGIGMGINNTDAYNRDFIYQVKYPNQNIGEKSTFSFTLKPNLYNNFNKNKKGNTIYLSLRLARTDPASKFRVKIENIKIKYKAE